MSFANLGCQNFGLTDPVTVTLDGNGVATAVTYDTAHQQATVPAAAMSSGGGWDRSVRPRPGHHGGKVQNPSHM